MLADPYEKNNVAAEHPDIVRTMRAAYEAWFKDVSATRGYDPPRILLGTKYENPVILTRQDWRGPRAGWTPASLGYWEVEVAETGTYEVTLQFQRGEYQKARLSLGTFRQEQAVPDGATACKFNVDRWEQGRGRLEAELIIGSDSVGPHQVVVQRVR
jgi:hypothetical protein